MFVYVGKQLQILRDTCVPTELGDSEKQDSNLGAKDYLSSFLSFTLLRFRSALSMKNVFILRTQAKPLAFT